MLKRLLRLIGAAAAHETEESAKSRSEGQERALPPLTMFVIADLHSCYYEDMRKIITAEEERTYDCIILCGDICAEDVKLISEHAKAPCLYVLGNHDTWHQNDGIQGIEDIDGKTVAINGAKISGVSGAPKYKDGEWGMRTEAEIAEKLEKISDTDILVSHESPYHFLSPNRAHAGFQAISDFLTEKKPGLHIFGHHHIDYIGMFHETKEICVYGAAIISTAPSTIEKIV